MPAVSPPTGPPRRAVIAGSAWAVTAIVATTATPALAASGTPTLSVTTPNMQAVAAGTTTVTITAQNGAGQPATGGSVSLTAPAGVTFSPASPTITGGTATTTMTTTNDWAVPGSTLAISAVGNGSSASAGLTVLGANAYGLNYNDNGQLGFGNTTPVTAATQLKKMFASPIVAASLSLTYGLIVLQDGTVWASGDNTHGQLGDGTTTSRTTWAKVPGLSGVTAVVASSECAYAIASGAVLSWGRNTKGMLGDGTANDRLTPGPVQGLTSGATALACSSRNGYALVNGVVKSWGAGGRLGNGTVGGTDSFSLTPVTVSGLSNVTAIASGLNTAYAVTNGEVWSWGSNTVGELGNGSTATDSLVPVRATGLTGVSAIASCGSGAHVIADGAARNFYSWGNRRYGARGSADAITRTPVLVSSLTGTTSIGGHRAGGHAVLGSTVYQWGFVSAGPTETTQNLYTATEVPGASGVTRFSTGGYDSGSAIFIV